MKMCFAPRTRWLALALAAMVGLAAMPNPVRADTIKFTLNEANTSTLGAGAFATVTVTLNPVIPHKPETATVTISADTGYGLAGGTGTIAVNVNGTASESFLPLSKLVADKAGNESSFGSFSNIAKFKSSSGNPSTASFVLTQTGGTTWLSAADVLTPNKDGNEVAAHIGLLSVTGKGFANTGFVVPSVATPEFGSASLMGLMMLGFGGMLGLRRLRKPAMA